MAAPMTPKRKRTEVEVAADQPGVSPRNPRTLVRGGCQPKDVLGILSDEIGLTQSSTIADIGSGTGISSELFLRNGNTVYAVEPNREMREAAESILSAYEGFHSIDGSAEDTSLPDACVDIIVAGQAFHWFDVAKAKSEFIRILRPSGWVALMWNTRRSTTTSFLQEYEALLQKYGTDYREVNHRNVDESVHAGFFAQSRYKVRSLYNEQLFDLEGLQGRLLSSSYAPGAGHPLHDKMLEATEALFSKHQEQGTVRFEYDTEIYFGHLT